MVAPRSISTAAGRRVTFRPVEPGTVGPSSRRAEPARRASPALWIGVALAIVGCVIVAAASGRGRGAASVAIVAEEPSVAGVAAAPMHPPVPLAPPARGAAPGAGTLADASRLVSIEMYSAAWCQACGRAKTWMRDQGITFHEVDVDRRAGALAQLQMLNPRSSLPTFDVDGRVVVGFEEARLRTAIDEAAQRTMQERP